MSEILQEYRPVGSHVLLITAALAQTGLTRIMEAIAPDDFTYEIRVMPVQVAAWLNADSLAKQIGDVGGFDLVVIPGKTSGEEYDIERALGVRVVRGPNCYSELPDFFEAQGFEPMTDFPRPKIVVRQADDVAAFLAKTYEIPLISMNDLIDIEISSGSDVGEQIAGSIKILHNVKAEILRSRLLMPDAKNGWVLVNYPYDLREVEWLNEISQPDVFLSTPEVTDEAHAHYKTRPSYIELTSVDPQKQKEDALVRVETMMQTCVAK